MHAVARAHAEELPHDVDAAAVVALLDGRVLRVAELPAREELLERERLVVRRVDAGEDLRRRRGDDVRGAGGDLQVRLEVVVDGETGLLVDPGDVQAVANSIVWLADDPSLRERLGQAGQRSVQGRFTLDAMVDAVLAVYAQVLG